MNNNLLSPTQTSVSTEDPEKSPDNNGETLINNLQFSVQPLQEAQDLKFDEAHNQVQDQDQELQIFSLKNLEEQEDWSIPQADQYYQDKDYKKAIQVYEEICRRELPGLIQAKARLMEIYIRTDNLKRAEELAENTHLQTEFLYPKGLMLCYQGQREEGKKLWIKGARIQECQLSIELYEKQEELQKMIKASLEKEDWKNAIELCKECLKLDAGDIYFASKLDADFDPFLSKINDQNLIESYKEAIKFDPESLHAYHGKADSVYNSKDYELAAKLYTKMIDLEIDGKDLKSLAYKKRGDAYRSLKKDEDSLSDYNIAIELNQNFAEAYLSRAILGIRMDTDFSDAFKDYNKAFTMKRELKNQDFILAKKEKVKILEQQEEEFCRQGSFSAAKECIDKIKKLVLFYSKRSCSKYPILIQEWEKAENFYNKKEYENALNSYRIIIQKSPNTFRAKNRFIEILALQGKCKEALEICEEHFTGLNHDADFYYAKGLALLNSGQKEKALTEWKEALKRDPDHKKSACESKVLKYYFEGKEAFRSMKYELAEEAHSKALKYNSGVQKGVISEVYMMKGQICKMLKRTTEAIINYNDAIIEDERNVDAYIQRGELLVELKRYKEAASDFGKAMELKKDSHEELKRRKEAADGKAQKHVENYYQILDIERTVEVKAIKTAYHKLSLIYHPDKRKAKTPGEEQELSEMYLRIQEGYNTLQDPKRREEYDKKLDESQKQSSSGFSFTFGKGFKKNFGGEKKENSTFFKTNANGGGFFKRSNLNDKNADPNTNSQPGPRKFFTKPNNFFEEIARKAQQEKLEAEKAAAAAAAHQAFLAQQAQMQHQAFLAQQAQLQQAQLQQAQLQQAYMAQQAQLQQAQQAYMVQQAQLQQAQQLYMAQQAQLQQAQMQQAQQAFLLQQAHLHQAQMQQPLIQIPIYYSPEW